MQVYCDMALICSVQRPGLLYPLKQKKSTTQNMNTIVPDMELLLGSRFTSES